MTFGVFCSANLPVKNALINSPLHIFVIVIISTNVSVYINHPQYYQSHKLKYVSVRHITSSETEQQQVFKWVYKFVTSNCHLPCHTSSVVKKWPMSLKFQVWHWSKVASMIGLPFYRPKLPCFDFVEYKTLPPQYKILPKLCCITLWSAKYGSLLKKSYLQYWKT